FADGPSSPGPAPNTEFLDTRTGPEGRRGLDLENAAQNGHFALVGGVAARAVDLLLHADPAAHDRDGRHARGARSIWRLRDGRRGGRAATRRRRPPGGGLHAQFLGPPSRAPRDGGRAPARPPPEA